MNIDNTEIEYTVEPVSSTEIIEDLQNDETIQESSTERVPEGETESMQDIQESTSQTVSVDYTATLESLGNDVHIIMFIVLFSFCWNCVKNWRTKSLKGVRK